MTLEELVVELEPVTNWFVLGLHLGVPVDELRSIQSEHMSTEYSRIKMLAIFLESAATKATWLEIVIGLTTIGELQLARAIASKYGKIMIHYVMYMLVYMYRGMQLFYIHIDNTMTSKLHCNVNFTVLLMQL